MTSERVLSRDRKRQKIYDGSLVPEMSSSANAGDVERAIVDSAEMMGYYMKVKQLEAVKALIEGNDTFV